MHEIKDYCLTDDTKRKLGTIIREVRKVRNNEFKEQFKDDLIPNNPYTKSNICDGVCHYNTLKKLEDGLVKDSNVYHELLERLDLRFQVEAEEHEENIGKLEPFISRLTYCLEYIDDEEVINIKNDLDSLDFSNDCIAHIYKNALCLQYNLQLFKPIKNEDIEIYIQYINIIDGVYKAFLYHFIAIYYMNQQSLDVSLHYYHLAKEEYRKYQIDEVIINAFLMGVYTYDKNYYELLNLSNVLEKRFEQTKNYKRLVHIYSYLSEYYLMINKNELAEDYFNKTIAIIEEHHTMERYKNIIYFNWSARAISEFMFDEAYVNLKHSLDCCNVNERRLKIYVNLLLVMSKLHKSEDAIIQMVEEADQYFQYGTIVDQTLFKYFKYKYQSPNYYRKYTYEQILPKIRGNKFYKDFLLFFYEDLYDHKNV